MSNIYGYARVSSQDQNEERQLIALREKQIAPDHIFVDKQSGKDFDRPQYQKMLKVLQPGDTLYVLSFDRLGRNYEELQNQWRMLTKEMGVIICVMDTQALEIRTGNVLLDMFFADMLRNVLSFLAQSERENIKQRQAQGIAAAKARGVHMGRPTLHVPAHFEKTLIRLEAGEISLAEAEKLCSMSRSTFYRRRREYYEFHSTKK